MRQREYDFSLLSDVGSDRGERRGGRKSAIRGAQKFRVPVVGTGSSVEKKEMIRSTLLQQQRPSSQAIAHPHCRAASIVDYSIMSVSSFTRPTLHRVCRSCRQRLFSQPQSTCLVPSAQLSTTPAPPPETLTGSPANRKTWARQPIGLAIQDGRNPDRPEEQLPRWQRTPQAMKAPIRINPRNRNMDFAVNEDPKKLDEVLARLLGQGTEDWLPQEVKFLAVTHKSFDYGRRGFNDRLAFLGT